MASLAEQTSSYLLWARERGLRYPRRAEPDDTKAGGSRLRVLFACEAALLPDEANLLGKMIAAMQLPPESVAVACGKSEVDAGIDRSPEVAIALGELSESSIRASTRHVVTIQHPRDLLRDPSKKREVWEELKLVMRALERKDSV